jgi:hypothetical protein
MPTEPATTANRRLGNVLVVGAILTQQPNTARHIVQELSRSEDWQIEQHWIAIGNGPTPTPEKGISISRVLEPAPKFALLNSVMAPVSIDEWDFIIVCDDDVELPEQFVDRYLEIVCRHDLALSQPARTHASFIDHRFVERLDGLTARWTRFVEIGPVVSMNRAAVAALTPFDETSPMGWGYDLAWPIACESAGLKMGIVDAVPVTHALRPPTQHYAHHLATSQMTDYLARRRHLSLDDACFIVEAYV